MKTSKVWNHPRYLGPEPEVAPPAPPPKTITQADVDAAVNKRLAEEKAKHNKETASTLERLKELETEATKRAELERRLEDIEREGKTKQQLDDMDRKKKEASLVAERDEATKKAKSLQMTLEAEKLARDLMDAASSKEADAYNARQIANLLAPAARIVERDGKMEVRVKYAGLKDGEPVELDATPAEAIKLMKEDPQNHNLFKAGITGGIGGTQVPRTAAKAGGKLGLSQEEFTKRYSKGTLPTD